MSRESREIREIMNDINENFKVINESYVFGHHKTERNIPEADDSIGGMDDIDDNNDDVDSIVDAPEMSGGSNIDSEVNSMRKTAIKLIGELNPMDDQEAYKLVKSIWDSCDKFLTKDIKQPKQDNQNNN